MFDNQKVVIVECGVCGKPVVARSYKRVKRGETLRVSPCKNCTVKKKALVCRECGKPLLRLYEKGKMKLWECECLRGKLKRLVCAHCGELLRTKKERWEILVLGGKRCFH